MPRYPSLYQINTRVWLSTVSRRLGRRATLDDVPDDELDQLAMRGFDWVWLLGVWQTGEAARAVSLSNPDWRREFEQTLPDLADDDIPGSCFAITAYHVHERLGSDAALARLRERLRRRGLSLLLDFVPNHMAPDHPWVREHPDYFIGGTEDLLAREPHNFCRVATPAGNRIVAYGRDPYFAGWPDTLQLDYANPAVQEAMAAELLRIAGQCDGARCDMAMLILPEVFERTWGRRPEPFWPPTIARVKEQRPDFTFLAEVYWDLEWALQQQGFDYTYDKRLYDRLREGHVEPIREHLWAGLDFQDRLARFLENHDEPRAAATFGCDQHRAAAIITLLAPGLRFFHQGQLEGRRVRISPHLGRGPDEPIDQPLAAFCARLLDLLRESVVREGTWRLLDCGPAWPGNESHRAFLAYLWEQGGDRRLIAVNYAPHASQCYVRLPIAELAGSQWRLTDRLGPASYNRDGNELASQGLYLDVPPWTCHAFVLTMMH